jgi:hypothetical protein
MRNVCKMHGRATAQRRPPSSLPAACIGREAAQVDGFLTEIAAPIRRRYEAICRPVDVSV